MNVRHYAAQWLRRAAKAVDQVDQNSLSASAQAALDEYVVRMPSAQNAIDALPGWNHALPPHLGVTAGQGAFYADTRIAWAIEQAGSLADKRVLELGPLEAAHTFMLEQQGPTVLHAIEANKLAFLRCLVVKEVMDLKIAKFFLGDFSAWLDQSQERFDFIVACGVLYHMQDPIGLLELIAERTDSFYLWTHYVSDEAMPPDDARRNAFVGEMEIEERRGVPVRLYKRSYLGAWKSKSYCGGAFDLHRWMEKSDLIALIQALGFSDIRVAHDEPGHLYGPACSIYAQR